MQQYNLNQLKNIAKQVNKKIREEHKANVKKAMVSRREVQKKRISKIRASDKEANKKMRAKFAELLKKKLIPIAKQSKKSLMENLKKHPEKVKGLKPIEKDIDDLPLPPMPKEKKLSKKEEEDMDKLFEEAKKTPLEPKKKVHTFKKGGKFFKVKPKEKKEPEEKPYKGPIPEIKVEDFDKVQAAKKKAAESKARTEKKLKQREEKKKERKKKFDPAAALRKVVMRKKEFDELKKKVKIADLPADAKKRYTFLIDKRKEDELDDEHVEELKDIVKKHEKKEPPKQAPNKINEFLKELKKQNLVVEGSASKKDIEEFTKNKNVISFQKNNPDAFETDMLYVIEYLDKDGKKRFTGINTAFDKKKKKAPAQAKQQTPKKGVKPKAKPSRYIKPFDKSPEIRKLVDKVLPADTYDKEDQKDEYERYKEMYEELEEGKIEDPDDLDLDDDELKLFKLLFPKIKRLEGIKKEKEKISAEFKKKKELEEKAEKEALKKLQKAGKAIDFKPSGKLSDFAASFKKK